MFLSKIELNYKTTPNMFRSVKDLHRFVYSAFQPGQTHKARSSAGAAAILYRLEMNGDLLVQSLTVPAWECPAQVKEFQPIVSDGDTFYFRLKANPIVKKNGKILPVLDRNQIMWLERKGRENGFDILSANVLSVKEHSLSNTDFAVIKAVTYEGMLQVSDSQQFIKGVERGVGRAKAWGCGLLSIARHH